MASDIVFEGQSGKTWRYDLGSPLGKPGGFGAVYEGWGADGTEMAVKVIRKFRGVQELDGRLLQREVEIGQRIKDAGTDRLLAVVDVAEAERELLLVMPRASRTLADVAMPLAEPDAVDALLQISLGLQELHTLGIIHRDLKPANVLEYEGRWMLADFGIARDQEIGTQDPTFIGGGSPPYMAPEIWESKSPTVKTDLYALGCLAFELVAGEWPFRGSIPEMREAHLRQQVPSVASSNSVLVNLIARLMDKDPGRRPQDVRAVLERLERVNRMRTPVQESIAKGLHEHTVQRSREAAERAAQEAEQEALAQQVMQAKADLSEIANDAFQDLLDVDPDARLIETNGALLALEANGARLRIQLWDAVSAQLVPGDTLTLAGEAIITNRSFSSELNAANLVYEKVGDRFVWQIYRFRASSSRPDRYEYGPYGRTHGLRYSDFMDPNNRYVMLQSGMHVWSKRAEPLTAESFLGLFDEAVKVRDPDPRTRIWS